MGTVIIIAVIAVISIIAVKTYIKNLTHGCCGTGDSEISGSENKGKADLSDYPHKCTVEISGMTCKNCSGRIEKRFNKLDGVSASVSHKDGRAEIYSLEPIDDLSVRRIVTELGYKAGKIER